MCEHVKFPDGHSAIVCGRRHSAPKYCACGRPADFLCDWKIPEKDSGTCDTPICASHTKQVGPAKHLCPAHQHQWDDWLKKHPPAQKSLFEGAA